MLQKIGEEDIYVKNYSSNFNIKEFIRGVLVPRAFPGLGMNTLNIGLLGITSEMVSTAIEDSFGTASLMMNEAFITRAQLPSSIYSHASLFQLGFNFASPSRCNILLQLYLEDIITKAEPIGNGSTKRYILDKDTVIVINNSMYRLDHDIHIDHKYIDGQLSVTCSYAEDSNPLATTSGTYIKHQITSSGWMMLYCNMGCYERNKSVYQITDNLVTVNSALKVSWTNQLAEISAVYISPSGERQNMLLLPKFTAARSVPYAWYQFTSDNSLELSFDNSLEYFQPSFNSRVEITTYTCNGAADNFTTYNNRLPLTVRTNGGTYEYNAGTRIGALCYSESRHGRNKGSMEDLRNEIINRYNSGRALNTDYDLLSWFRQNAAVNGVYSKFLKRRDDISGRMFSQFISISDDNGNIIPTNTLNIQVNKADCDFINDNTEYIIRPGHIWQYVGNSRDTITFLKNIDNKPSMVTDDNIPPHEYGFVNPFYIRINEKTNISTSYNTMVSHTTYPEMIYLNPNTFFNFQLSTMSIEHDLSKDYADRYRIQVTCIPVTTTNIPVTYIEGIGDKFPKKKNNLRLVLAFKSKNTGYTGYIEMEPTEIINQSAVVFETSFAVLDNMPENDIVNIDMRTSTEFKSLIHHGPQAGHILIDTKNTEFGIYVLMKDLYNTAVDKLYDDDSFTGYITANIFKNDASDFSIYEIMNMMRSYLTFTPTQIGATLIPMMGISATTDDDSMSIFVDRFREQYKNMEPILSHLEGNSYLDFKLFNTYGRSNNYFIGPEREGDALENSNIRLDNVQLKLKLVISVFNRSIFSSTVASIKNIIQSYISSINDSSTNNIHASDIIYHIKENEPNVRYIRFVGFNNYDANKQSIFRKYDPSNKVENIQTYVPELVRINDSDITIVEEV